MAYGYQVDPRSMPPEAREQDVVAELALRISKLETRLLVPTLMTGSILGVPAFLVVRALQLRLTGFASWRMCALGALVPMLGAGFLGRFLAHLIARQRLRAWLGELERTHELPRARLEELARTIRALK
jgi:hypothetical protein